MGGEGGTGTGTGTGTKKQNKTKQKKNSHGGKGIWGEGARGKKNYHANRPLSLPLG